MHGYDLEMPHTPSLVLLPGMNGTGKLFRPFVQALAGQFTVITAEYPGDQRVTYSALVDTVRSLLPASGPYVLVAESFSTPIAILCAAQADDNLRGLVLCAGFAHSPVPSWLALLAPLLRPAFSMPLPEMLTKHLLLGNSARALLLGEVRNAVACVKPYVLSQRLRAIMRCDVRRELALTTLPLLYVRATQDRLVGMRSFEDIRAVRPDALLIEIEAPHLVLQREPEESAMAISAFVQELS